MFRVTPTVRADGRMYVPARVIRQIREHGNTRVLVECLGCGKQQPVHLRSWAGSGKKCLGCQCFLERRDNPGG